LQILGDQFGKSWHTDLLVVARATWQFGGGIERFVAVPTRAPQRKSHWHSKWQSRQPGVGSLNNRIWSRPRLVHNSEPKESHFLGPRFVVPIPRYFECCQQGTRSNWYYSNDDDDDKAKL
jgi:hypothetical protein